MAVLVRAVVSVLSAHGERFRNRRRASRAEGREIRQIPRRPRRKGVVARKLVDESFPTLLLFPKGRSGYVKLGSERRDPDSLEIFIESITGKL